MTTLMEALQKEKALNRVLNSANTVNHSAYKPYNHQNHHEKRQQLAWWYYKEIQNPYSNEQLLRMWYATCWSKKEEKRRSIAEIVRFALQCELDESTYTK